MWLDRCYLEISLGNPLEDYSFLGLRFSRVTPNCRRWKWRARQGFRNVLSVTSWVVLHDCSIRGLVSQCAFKTRTGGPGRRLQYASYGLWIFCPVAWKTSRNTPHQGKSCGNPFSLIPEPPLWIFGLWREWGFSTEKASPAEQETLFHSLYWENSEKAQPQTDRQTMTLPTPGSPRLAGERAAPLAFLYSLFLPYPSLKIRDKNSICQPLSWNKHLPLLILILE